MVECEAIDPTQRIAQLEAENATLQTEVHRLTDLVAQLTSRVEELERAKPGGGRLREAQYAQSEAREAGGAP